MGHQDVAEDNAVERAEVRGPRSLASREAEAAEHESGKVWETGIARRSTWMNITDKSTESRLRIHGTIYSRYRREIR